MEKKPPLVLSGKKSVRKIKKKGIILTSKIFELSRNELLFFIKNLYNNIKIKNKIILKPKIPKSLNI